MLVALRQRRHNAAVVIQKVGCGLAFGFGRTHVCITSTLHRMLTCNPKKTKPVCLPSAQLARVARAKQLTQTLRAIRASEREQKLKVGFPCGHDDNSERVYVLPIWM